MNILCSHVWHEIVFRFALRSAFVLAFFASALACALAFELADSCSTCACLSLRVELAPSSVCWASLSAMAVSGAIGWLSGFPGAAEGTLAFVIKGTSWLGQHRIFVVAFF